MVSFLFRVINLALVSGIGVYLFRRFALPHLHQGVIQENQAKSGLEREQIALKDLQVQLDQDIKTQDILCAQLSVKVDRWQQEVFAQQQHKQQEQVKMESALERRYVQQQENYSAMHMVKQLAPVVHQQLEQELIDYFADRQAAQEAYITIVIEHLKKNI